MGRGKGLVCAGHSWFQLASQKTQLAKAKPISEAGGAAVKTYIRKGKNAE